MHSWFRKWAAADRRVQKTRLGGRVGWGRGDTEGVKGAEPRRPN